MVQIIRIITKLKKCFLVSLTLGLIRSCFKIKFVTPEFLYDDRGEGAVTDKVKGCPFEDFSGCFLKLVCATVYAAKLFSTTKKIIIIILENF